MTQKSKILLAFLHAREAANFVLEIYVISVKVHYFIKYTVKTYLQIELHFSGLEIFLLFLFVDERREKVEGIVG